MIIIRDLEKMHSANIKSLQKVLDYNRESQATLLNELKQTKTALQKAVDTATKKQQILTYITWALVVVAIIITFVLKKL